MNPSCVAIYRTPYHRTRSVRSLHSTLVETIRETRPCSRVTRHVQPMATAVEIPSTCPRLGLNPALKATPHVKHHVTVRNMRPSSRPSDFTRHRHPSPAAGEQLAPTLTIVPIKNCMPRTAQLGQVKHLVEAIDLLRAANAERRPLVDARDLCVEDALPVDSV